MVTPSQGTPTSVYRYYDEHGILIYVGITRTGILRNRQHNADKDWWPRVVTQEIEHYDSYADAHNREIILIQRYRPPFNKQHNKEYEHAKRAYLYAIEHRLFHPQPPNVHQGGVLPKEARTFQVDVIRCDGREAVLRTRMENEESVRRIKHVPGGVVRGVCPRTNNTMDMGSVRSVAPYGFWLEITLDIKGWMFSGAEVFLKPTMEKGRPVPYYISQVMVSGAEDCRLDRYAVKKAKKAVYKQRRAERDAMYHIFPS